MRGYLIEKKKACRSGKPFFHAEQDLRQQYLVNDVHHTVGALDIGSKYRGLVVDGYCTGQ
jgi:hypothetical protein